MPARTKIEKIMTTGLFTVGLDDTVKTADNLMRNENIRHVPVVDGSKFVGMITERSLMEYSLRQMYDFDEHKEDIERNVIRDYRRLVSKDLKVIYPEDSVLKASELMAKYKTDFLPVVDWENNLLGIVTSVDVMLFVYKMLSEEA